MNNTIAYLFYLSASLFVVIWVGKILHRNGKLFLESNCPDKELADNTNNILYICYCLVNGGFAFYSLNACETLKSIDQIIAFVGEELGTLLLTLSIMHYLNMLIVPKVISLFANTTNTITNQLETTSNTKTTKP